MAGNQNTGQGRESEKRWHASSLLHPDASQKTFIQYPKNPISAEYMKRLPLKTDSLSLF
jgi:hypothetical protein